MSFTYFNRLPCPSSQAGTPLSLTVTLSGVEGCFKFINVNESQNETSKFP